MGGNESCAASSRSLKGYDEIKSHGSFCKKNSAPNSHNTRFKDSACVSTSTQRIFRCDAPIVQASQIFV